MVRTLGLSVGARSVHGVLMERGTVVWAGSASYDSLPELTEAIARLAGESGRPARAARIVLGRDVVQLRTLLPAPPLKLAAARRYVALEAARLFRKNGDPLVTDAVTVPTGEQGLALFAAGAPQAVLEAILKGCAQAGLGVERIAPAAEVLTASLARNVIRGDLTFADGGAAEVLSIGPQGVWRSRLQNGLAEGMALEWAVPLRALGEQAPQFAAAYGAAVAVPRLELWPAEARRLRARDARRRVYRLEVVGLACWVLAGGVYVGRLMASLHSSTRYLEAVSGQLDSALALRRDFDAGRATLATIVAARATRSRRLELLAQLTSALPDSAVALAFTVGPNATVRLAGLAPSGARVAARLERFPELRGVRLEGPVTRETGAGGVMLDRFAIVARVGGGP